MATKDTRKTIVTLGIVGVIIFLAVKLWPAIAKKINLSSGGGGTGGGPGSIGGGSPYGQQPSGGPQLPSISFGGGGNPSGAPGAAPNQNALISGLQQMIQTFASQGSYAGSTPAQQEYIDSLDVNPLSAEALDNDADYPDSIPDLPTQNYDVNQNAVDLPGADDGSADVSSYDGTPSGGDGSDLSDYGFSPDYGGGGGDDQQASLDYSTDDGDDSGD
jgi:hypothetical protein